MCDFTLGIMIERKGDCSGIQQEEIVNEKSGRIVPGHFRTGGSKYSD